MVTGWSQIYLFLKGNLLADCCVACILKPETYVYMTQRTWNWLLFSLKIETIPTVPQVPVYQVYNTSTSPKENKRSVTCSTSLYGQQPIRSQLTNANYFLLVNTDRWSYRLLSSRKMPNFTLLDFLLWSAKGHHFSFHFPIFLARIT